MNAPCHHDPYTSLQPVIMSHVQMKISVKTKQYMSRIDEL